MSVRYGVDDEVSPWPNTSSGKRPSAGGALSTGAGSVAGPWVGYSTSTGMRRSGVAGAWVTAFSGVGRVGSTTSSCNRPTPYRASNVATGSVAVVAVVADEGTADVDVVLVVSGGAAVCDEQPASTTAIV